MKMRINFLVEEVLVRRFSDKPWVDQSYREESYDESTLNWYTIVITGNFYDYMSLFWQFLKFLVSTRTIFWSFSKIGFTCDLNNGSIAGVIPKATYYLRTFTPDTTKSWHKLTGGRRQRLYQLYFCKLWIKNKSSDLNICWYIRIPSSASP